MRLYRITQIRRIEYTTLVRGENSMEAIKKSETSKDWKKGKCIHKNEPTSEMIMGGLEE